jgi:Metallo-peptidase family M12
MPWTLNRMILAGCASLLALTPPASAASRPAGAPLRAVTAGRLMTAPAGGGEAEAVELAPSVVPSLTTLSAGSSLAVADWPVSPGVRQEVEFTRFEVYAPDARIVEIEGGRAVELPRSRNAFFHGRSVDDPETRLVVTVDPDTRELRGVAYGREGTHELRPWGEKGTGGGYLVAASGGFETQPAAEPAWSCGQELDPLAQGVKADPLSSAPPGATATAPIGAAVAGLSTATIAVDTDNELLQLKFGNDTTAATNYIANLFALMNVMYERDLQVRLLQGLTILRPSTTPDPYVKSAPSAADGSVLGEFSSYWGAGCNGACAGVSRAAAMMLSGKQSSSYSASGIAWIDSLCSFSTGYSFSQVFKFAQDTSVNDAPLVGHEIGHNFGSPHTHCYSPPIDTCWNGEACYTGGTSCPAPATINGLTNVTGTVMSYCHLTGCGSTAVFHPRTVSLLAPKIQARVGQCIAPLGPPSAIFRDGFESGNKSSWQ